MDRDLLTRIGVNFDVFCELHIPTDWLIRNYTDDWLRCKPVVMLLRERIGDVKLEWSDLQLMIYPQVYGTFMSAVDSINRTARIYNGYGFPRDAESLIQDEEWRGLVVRFAAAEYLSNQRKTPNSFGLTRGEAMRVNMETTALKREVVRLCQLKENHTGYSF